MTSIIKQLSSSNQLLTEALKVNPKGKRTSLEQEKIDHIIEGISSTIFKDENAITRVLFESKDSGKIIRELFRSIGANIRKFDNKSFKIFQQRIAKVCKNAKNLNKDYSKHLSTLISLYDQVKKNKNSKESIKEVGLWLEANYKVFMVKNMKEYIGSEHAEFFRDMLYDLQELVSKGPLTDASKKLMTHIDRILGKHLGQRTLPQELEITVDTFSSENIYATLLADTPQNRRRSFNFIMSAINEKARKTGEPRDLSPLAQWINAKHIKLLKLDLNKKDLFELAPRLEYVNLDGWKYQEYLHRDKARDSKAEVEVWQDELTEEDILQIVQLAAPKVIFLTISELPSLPDNFPNLQELRCSLVGGQLGSCPQLQRLGCTYCEITVLSSYPLLEWLYVYQCNGLTTMGDCYKLKTILTDFHDGCDWFLNNHQYPNLDISTCDCDLPETVLKSLKTKVVSW